MEGSSGFDRIVYWELDWWCMCNVLGFYAFFKFANGFDSKNFDKRYIKHDARCDGETGGQKEVLHRSRVWHNKSQSGAQGCAQAGGSDNAKSKADIAIKTVWNTCCRHDSPRNRYEYARFTGGSHLTVDDSDPLLTFWDGARRDDDLLSCARCRVNGRLVG